MSAQFGWTADQPRRLLTFALNGRAVLPPPVPKTSIKAFDDPNYRFDPAAERLGRKKFADHCFSCHGLTAISSGDAPDLRASEAVMPAETFDAILRDGLLVPNGMPRFEDYDEKTRAAVRQYIRKRAADLRRGQEAESSGAAQF